ncbi:MAG: SHOCT domain-containing protein [Lachnospiraceae bacterium]|nr:SHOCT domain-containing protein [Lachnospiraceae bacterium]
MDVYSDFLKIISKGDKQSKEVLSILNEELSLPNAKLPTMGGKVFWTTIVEYGGWKLQQNDITHHARILDENNVRVAWGTINGMYKAMDRLVRSVHRYDDLQPSSKDRMDSMEEIAKLKDLLDKGAITEQEYQEKKEKMLRKI